MADIFLAPLLQVFYEKLASPALQKLGVLWDLTDDFQKLQQTLPIIQALLEDAEERQRTDRAVQIWLSKLNDAACKAEDLIEAFNQKGTGCMYNMLPVSVVKVREMLKVLERAATEGFNLQLRERNVVDRRFDKRETGSIFKKSEVYGREEDKRKILELLLSSKVQSCDTLIENVSVIPIVGQGGVGKTTLAQLAYNDEKVTQHFELRMWVFVSHDFDVKKIIKAAIESATKNRCDLSEMDALQSELWDTLDKKRYLLVLDDVWSDDQFEWDRLRPLFGGVVDGSKIIVTNRSTKVALIMDTPNSAYYLEGLPEDDCWTLFKHCVFHREEEGKHPNLLPIGKQIIKKCRGLPLAAKTLGSLLRVKREERQWLFVQNSNLWC